MEKDEEEDVDDKGATLLPQKTTMVKALPTGAFSSALTSARHRDVSRPKSTSFRTLGKASTLNFKFQVKLIAPRKLVMYFWGRDHTHQNQV